MAGPSLFSIIEMLPQILLITQIVMYLALAWAFGSVAFIGMKKRLSFAIRIIAMLGAGFLCLVIGAALRKYMFFFEGTILQTFQIDFFLAGLMGSVIIAFAFYTITRKEKKTDKDSMIKKLQERVSLLEGILLKYHVPMLGEEEVRKTAETLVPGFAARHADLKGSDWEILLEKEERKAKVILGGYTGEVKKIEHIGMNLLSDPLRIIGIGLVVSLLAFSLINFGGFPNIFEGVASLLGMSPEQFNMLMGGSEDLPEGCVSAMRLLTRHGISVLGGEGSYTNEEVKGMIESETGRKVMLMYETDFEGRDYILSITLPGEMDFLSMTNEDIIKNSEVCSSTEEIFCNCLKLPEVDIPTGFILAV
jgi:hypothetical protein